MSRKFTLEVRGTILAALRENPSIYSAAAKADIGYPTLMRWLERGQEGVEGYAEFLQEVEAARSQMKDEIVQSLYEIATDRLHPQAVRAARELLSALYPREFSTVKHVVTHRADKGPSLDLSKLSQEELRSFHRTLKRLQSENDAEPKPPVMVVEAIEADAGKKISRNPDAN